MSLSVVLESVLILFFTVLRLCQTQNGSVCYVTSSQVSTQSYYVQTSYTYYYDCSNFGWGWSYCTATGYTSSLTYASATAYVAQFTCCTGYSQVGTTQTCADINECASNGGLGPCQQICTNTIGSFYCSCSTGYTLSGVLCNDINECSPNGALGPCQQNCTNTIGSYYCSCQPGYALSADGTSCHVIGPSSTRVVSSSVTSTATLPSNINAMMLPAPTQSAPALVYIQVRLLNVANCSIWRVPAAIELLYQSIDDNSNGYCKCNITVTNAEVICYDVTRVTLRGTVEAMQLPYLQNWVANEATNLDILGTLLKVDKSCPVQIQSFDDPECPVVANVDAQQTVDRGTIGLSAGLAIGGVAAVAGIGLAAAVVIALLIKKKKYRENTIINPLYSGLSCPKCDENIYNIPDDPTEMSKGK